MAQTLTETTQTKFDVIIAGAGSAGCVLAERLSEDAGRSVLLLDAGPDYGENVNHWPTDLVSANVLVASHDWDCTSEPDESGNRLPLFRGKVVGGSSATNNVIALRGQPSDYDAWSQAGNHEWSFEQVLPFFRKLERDVDFVDQWHGAGGPVTIRRPPLDQMIPVQRAFLDSSLAEKHPWTEDHNAPGAAGAGRLPENVVAGVRQSTALTYLAAARKRSNLTVLANVLVDRVEINKDRAVAVRLADPSLAIPAEQIILAAGVYGSPAILLRSGIGPSEHLRDLGIPVICDLPGVGANLQDHPLLWLHYGTTAKAQPPGHPIRQTILTARSSAEQSGPDTHIFPSGPTECDQSTCLKLLVGLMKPESRGQLSLTSPDPDVPPRIDSCLLSHPADLPRLFAGLRLARDIAAREPLAGYLTDEVWPGLRVQSEEELAKAIRRRSASVRFSSYQHGVGTCRMGPNFDRMAVVSSMGAVHGVNSLHVVDASIMPSIPAANTNIPTIMLAERIASTWA